MATIIKWDNSLSVVSVLTTELNSLANNAAAITATAFDNTSNLAERGDIELVATWGTNPTADSVVECYFARTADQGSNYEDASTTGPIVPGNGYVGAFILRAVTTAQRIIIPRVELPPYKMHVLVVNKSGQTTAASGNTLKIYPYRRTIV